jgi:hypothetical protein
VQQEALCLVRLDIQNHLARLIGVNLATMTTMVVMMAVRVMGLELLAKTTVTMAVTEKMMAVKMMAVKMVKVLPCYLHFVRHPWLTICLHRLYLLPLVQVH